MTIIFNYTLQRKAYNNLEMELCLKSLFSWLSIELVFQYRKGKFDGSFHFLRKD